MIKAIYEKFTANNIFNGERLKAFRLEIQGMPTFATSSKYYFRGFRYSKQTRKINFQIRKEEVKLSLFTNNMIVYLENPKDYTNKVRSNK